IRIDKSELTGRKIPGQPRQCSGKHEGSELVYENRMTDGAHTLFVYPNAGQRAAEWSMEQPIEKSVNNDEKNKCQIVKLRRTFEIERFEAGDAKLRAHVDIDAVGAAAELGVMKDRVDHLRKGKCYHDEVDAGGTNDQEADDERGGRGSGEGEGQGKPEVGRLVLWRDERQGVGRDAEIRGGAAHYHSRW